MASTRDLATFLERVEVVGGFDRTLDPTYSINACIDIKHGIDFGAVANFCSRTPEQDKYTLIFTFFLFSLGRAEMQTLKIWLAFAFFDELKTLKKPGYKSFDHFRRNQPPRLDMLVSILRRSAPVATDEGLSVQALNRIAAERAARIESDCRAFAEFLLPQWPSLKPDASDFRGSTILIIANAMRVVVPEWTRLYQNRELAGYAREVQKILDAHGCDDASASPALRQPSRRLSSRLYRNNGLLTLPHDLLEKPGPSPLQFRDMALTSKTNMAQLSDPRSLRGESIIIRLFLDK